MSLLISIYCHRSFNAVIIVPVTTQCQVQLKCSYNDCLRSDIDTVLSALLKLLAVSTILSILLRPGKDSGALNRDLLVQQLVSKQSFCLICCKLNVYPMPEDA